MAETTAALLLERARAHPDRVAIRALAAGGAAVDESLTWGEWAALSRRFGAALLAAGLQPGDRVAILAGNRTIWPVAELGVLLAGGVSVGLYPTSSAVQVGQVLADSGATTVVVDTAEQLAKVLSQRPRLPELRTVVCQEAHGEGVTGWSDWLTQGGAPGGAMDREVEVRGTALDPRADAILIYTSGSTGEPKGARISHQCLRASAASIGAVLGLDEDDSSLSFLPFCHAAERVFGLHTRIVHGMAMGLVADHTRLWDAAREFAPTVFGGVPRFYEKVWEELHRERMAAAPAERERRERVLEVGGELSRARRAGAEISPTAFAEWLTLSSDDRARLGDQFGGRVRIATSGGATFPQRVAEDLDALGLTVLGAYGLTEHLCVAFNRPHRYTFDSAGPPMPGTDLRIAEDGEILIRRSVLTFSGYHARPEETAATFTADGEWLMTGDLGSLNDDGMLRVTGRKKELIALSGGKKVAPLPIEAMLGRHPWIEQAVVTGEGRQFLSALITLRGATVEQWAAEQGDARALEDLLTDPRVIAEVQQAVNEVNALLSRPEQVRRFVLLERPLSVEADELTPTLKVRRAVVTERYRDRLESLYLQPEHS